jgi:ligand-binding sensor domain-containing protein
MIRYFLSSIFYVSLIIITFSLWTSCSRQPGTQSHSKKAIDLKTSPTGKPVLTKTQESNEYQVIKCGLQDKDGNIWFGTTSEGVYRFNGKVFTQFTRKDGLSSNCVWSILEDNTGNIWFGTSDGICRTDGNKIISVPIGIYMRPVITDNSFYTEWSTKNSVWSMLQDKHGKIWFGTGDGVYSYNGANFTRLLANDNVINRDSLKLKLVSDILEDKNGNIWFASGMPPGNEGFCRYDGKIIESFRPKNEGWIRNVVESKNGNLLLATRHYGIWAYDGKSFTDYSQPKDLINGSLNAILEDKAGNLWVASDYGKKLGDTLGGLWHSTILPGKHTAIKFKKIFNKEVSFILEDKDNNIWFGTRNTDLYRYDRKILTKFSE